jgi:hypothetical protein
VHVPCRTIVKIFVSTAWLNFARIKEVIKQWRRIKMKKWDQNGKYLRVLIYENCENGKYQREKL